MVWISVEHSSAARGFGFLTRRPCNTVNCYFKEATQPYSVNCSYLIANRWEI